MDLSRERARILDEYRRREATIPLDRYAAWNPAEQFIAHVRTRLAARLLHAAGLWPDAGTRCLELGFGRCGWLPTLIGWGASERRLHGVEIDPRRVAEARRRLPAARLAIADAGRLPWPDGSFRLAILSTVVSSILDPDVRQQVARETERVLAPGGGLLWYDFAADNPRNPHVRGVRRRELEALFPDLSGEVRSVTLAPPLVRRLAPRGWWLAELFESLPLLRTHLLAVLVKR